MLNLRLCLSGLICCCAESFLTVWKDLEKLLVLHHDEAVRAKILRITGVRTEVSRNEEYCCSCRAIGINSLFSFLWP